MSGAGSEFHDWRPAPAMPLERVESLAARLQCPPAFARLLLSRGLTEASEIRGFLAPRLHDLHDPYLLPDMELAVRRVESAIAKGEKVLVHGDYDADGMSATALLTLALRRAGADVESFVPHRTRDGYDLSEAGLVRAARIGASLIVTADCGVTAVDAVARARRQGRDVVVTDHHRPGDRMPAALAVVNPMRPDNRYPFRPLAGVGVAFKLVQALFDRAGIPDAEANQHLDLVAIGTVADQMPLQDENRILVKAGLRALARSRKPGVRALLEKAGVTGSESIGAEQISYRLGPRLNSVGRMGSADSGLQLLVTEDPREAERLAGFLDRRNSERRLADQRVYAEVETLVAERFDPDEDRAVVVWGDNWHPGVIGIVASRIVDATRRPAIVVSFDGEIGRGSGRSVGGFELHAALEQLSSQLERYGGHRMAAGLSIRRERMQSFADRFLEIASREIGPEPAVEAVAVDVEIAVSEVDRDLMTWLERAGPFGEGNPAPVFVSRAVRLRQNQAVGPGGAHLRFLIEQQGERLEGIGFGAGSRRSEAEETGTVDVAYRLEENQWNGRRRIQAQLVDFRPATV
ncbi:MAG: single-stranded-DNA-specific exonuclease RecJ [marine benthic group bacterium]|nr:single-stranded-DNA-specific exonuclease RecJ [Gemmatimonadota bacterium]